MLDADLFRITKPVAPAKSELSKMLIFALWMMSGLLKANNVMKIDIVNPMPPRKPAPTICCQATSVGN